ncbi:single-stranded DNA-binding protein [Sporomusa sphaeroides DSM 2875]|uniref:single-stranded DNA-binding protein n=1 Tax=Sporomusa sphaeroides TaxID=47679 RepID=UPI00202E241B|nr:single-stranded DNA-binding protein [Sporomusa sphaeroides]MCM0760485.1 single-stranded DNA-binding protein [Sporomusa sphaeroides DSM 2875]
MNKVILVGRLTKDPEVRYTASGKAVASFTLAVNRIGSEATDFIPIVVWEKQAEACGNNIVKGQKVLIEGRLQIRSYETNDGQKRRVSEIVAQYVDFLERRKSSEGNQEFDKMIDEIGEEIPF